MRNRRARFVLAVAVTLAALAMFATACSGKSGSSPTASTPSTDRPSSPARLAIVSPTNGEVVRGSSVRLEVTLKGAKLVPASTTHVVPDEGHLHVSLDGQLVSMTSGLEQKVGGLTPGQHLIRVEFVASDHIPFDPRVIEQVVFEVQG